jgi:hypothetical protein
MKRTQRYQPKSEHKFSFGLWTVGNGGRDPIGDFLRPALRPTEIVSMLEGWARLASICTIAVQSMD